MADLGAIVIDPEHLDFRDAVDQLLRAHEKDGEDYTREEVAAALLTYVERIVFSRILLDPAGYLTGPNSWGGSEYADALHNERDRRKAANLLRSATAEVPS